MGQSIDRLLSRLEEVPDVEEEAFHAFSQPHTQRGLGFVDPKAQSLHLVVGGEDLTIQQSPSLLQSNRKEGTTGAVVWSITPPFATWLCEPSNVLFDTGILHSDATILELGAGVAGIIPLVLRHRIGRYVATDQGYVLRLLRRNIESNVPSQGASPGASTRGRSARRRGRGSARRASRAGSVAGTVELLALDWEADAVSALGSLAKPPGGAEGAWPGVDTVLACDCIYNESLIGPFVKTCADICRLRAVAPSGVRPGGAAGHKPTVCVIAQPLRSVDVFEAWLRAFARDFGVWRVPDEVLGEGLTIRDGFVVHVGILKSGAREG